MEESVPSMKKGVVWLTEHRLYTDDRQMHGIEGSWGVGSIDS